MARRSDSQRLPDFFLVGTGKAGTTSLYHYLGQHPQIYMSPIKEPCYFAEEIRVDRMSLAFRRNIERTSQKLSTVIGTQRTSQSFGWIISDWDSYVELFRGAGAALAVGEASAAYLWSESAAEQIFRKCPEARIIMILRDPAERAFSQYLHQLVEGYTRATFREHLEQCVRAQDNELTIYNPFLSVGSYHRQVCRYLEWFPRDHVRILWYEEVWARPHDLLSSLFSFLGVDPTFQPDTSERKLKRRVPVNPRINQILRWSPSVHWIAQRFPGSIRAIAREVLSRDGQTAVMSPDDRKFLIDYYRSDIQRLAALLDRDLTSWLN